MPKNPLLIKKECLYSLSDCLNALSKKQLLIITDEIMPISFKAKNHTKAVLVPALQTEIQRRVLYAFKYLYPFVSAFFVGFVFTERTVRTLVEKLISCRGSEMKLTGIIFFACFIFFSPFLFAQAEDRALPDPNNPDCMYEKAQLGELFIHMAKITDPSKGSAPAVEVLFNSDFKWEVCSPDDGWGREDKTYRYHEEEVPGTAVFFTITNKLNDVTYYRIEGIYPFELPLYDEPAEAEMLKRFVFLNSQAMLQRVGILKTILII